MDNADLISVLNQYKVSHQAKYGIKRLGLFGSAARGTATGQSDIDIVVELEKQAGGPIRKSAPVNLGLELRKSSDRLSKTRRIP